MGNRLLKLLIRGVQKTPKTISIALGYLWNLKSKLYS